LTPIHIAAAWGRYDILKLLLDCGGDPEIRDLNKKTALHYAVEEEYLDCYKLLKLYVTDKASIIFREKEDCINYATSSVEIPTMLRSLERVPEELRSICCSCHQ
jgi:ankyrin repeat protein